MKKEAYCSHRKATTHGQDRAHRPVRVLSLLGVLASCVACVAGAQGAPALEEIVWSETNEYAEFIPAPRLADPHLETLMLPKDHDLLVRTMFISKSRITNSDDPYCSGNAQPPRGANKGTYLDAMLDVMLLAEETNSAPGWVVVVGTIEDSIAGWHGQNYNEVATRSLLRLHEILFDEADRLVGAEYVTFWDHYGVVSFADTELCSKNYGRSEPTVGDGIVLAGWISETAGTRIQHQFHFLMRDGQVLHEPYISDSNWQPVTLEDLRQGIARRAKQKESLAHGEESELTVEEPGS